MVLRTKWLRLRRRWICAGFGAACLTGLAISGCSRAPMARFKEMTTAPEATADASDEPRETTRSASTERPDPRDPIARMEEKPRDTEGRVSVVGNRTGRTTLQKYREGYADLRDRVLNRGPAESRDPFLGAETSDRSRDFPSTEEIAPRGRQAYPPRVDGTVARADLTPNRGGAVGAASIHRPAASEGVATVSSPGVVKTSRLEQLREELRNAQVEAAPFPSATEPAIGTRGTPLPDSAAIARDEAAGHARTEPTPSPEPRPDNSLASGTASSSGEGMDVSLRVQSLLTSAEWLASRGDLEQAYRNTVLAQHLAEYGHVAFGPQDRRPEAVAEQVWEKMQGSASTSELAHNLPKPKLPSGAARRPVPEDAFPVRSALGWNEAHGPLPLISPQGKQPMIVPRGDEAGPQLSSPQTDQSLDDVASTESRGPVSLARIETDRDPAAQPKPRPSAAPKAAPKAASPVVTALAESPEPSATPKPPKAKPGPRLANAEPTGLTVPAMATLPKVPQTLPPQSGPALKGPKLAQAESADPPPPFLEVMGARQLPGGTPVVAKAEGSKRGILWGLGGLIAVLLGSAVAFRRRWSAAAAKPSTPTEAPQG